MMASRSRSSKPSKTVSASRDRQGHVVGDGPPLDRHAEALGPQAAAVAHRAVGERPIRDPAPPAPPRSPSSKRRRRLGITPSKSRPNGSGSAAFFFFAAAARAPSAGWRPLRPPALPLAPGPKSSSSRCLRRQPGEGRRRIDAPVPRNRGDGLAHQRRVAARPRRNRPLLQRQRVVGHDAARIEVPGRAQPLAAGARAVRRVERERARRHLRDADAADHARQLPRVEPVAVLVRLDQHHIVGELERDVHRGGQPALDAAAHDQAVDDDVDVVVAPAVERDVLVERSQLSVDARLGEAARAPAPAAPS